MNICVFCSAYNSDEKYTVPARRFGSLIGEGGHTLIWGASDKGLMREVAVAAKASGAKLIGVTIPIYADAAAAYSDEIVAAENLTERRSTFLSLGDAFVLLPGGIGSLDEITDILELRKQRIHTKPSVILNSAGFYNDLKSQFMKMESEGFTSAPVQELVTFVDTPEDAMRSLITVSSH